MNEQEIKIEKEKLEKLSKTYSMGSDGWNSVISGLTRIVLEEFNNSSTKYSETLIMLAKVNITLAVFMILLIIFQINLTIQQNNYVEVQSRSARLKQQQSEQRAVKFCDEQSPESTGSGMFNVSTGEPMPCKQVLQLYKNSSR